jgi:hypothetical protein
MRHHICPDIMLSNNIMAIIEFEEKNNSIILGYDYKLLSNPIENFLYALKAPEPKR